MNDVPVSAMIPPASFDRNLMSIPLPSIHSPVLTDKCIKIDESIVGYFDILGFASKKNWHDMELSLLDFVGPLLTVAQEYRDLRVNVFSDCAFVCASLKQQERFLAGVRYAFGRWVADGILVRGGVSTGSYNETKASHVIAASDNFTGNLFGGNGVAKAVQNEKGGDGALLFTDISTAEIMSENSGEPVFCVQEDRLAIGWGNDPTAMYYFVGISFIRLLLALRMGSEGNEIASKLRTNIIYGVKVSNGLYARFVVYAICSSSVPTDEAEVQKALSFVGLHDERKKFCKAINAWRENDRETLIMLGLMDSSVNPDMSIWESVSMPNS